MEQHHDEILAPAHYLVGGIEPLDVLKTKLTPQQWEGFLMGSIIDYLLRANHKGQKEKDIQKAAFYARLLAGDDPRKGSRPETTVVGAVTQDLQRNLMSILRDGVQEGAETPSTPVNPPPAPGKLLNKGRLRQVVYQAIRTLYGDGRSFSKRSLMEEIAQAYPSLVPDPKDEKVQYQVKRELDRMCESGALLALYNGKGRRYFVTKPRRKRSS